MIISKTPYRLSLCGGGTEYVSAIKAHNGGMVVGTTIDKYCYIASMYLTHFFSYNSKFVYSQIETVNKLDDVQHKAIKAVLQLLKIDGENTPLNLETHYFSDLPSFIGLGSSSSFITGLINSLSSMMGKPLLARDLMYKSIFVEQELLKETIGLQDSAFAGVGGFNIIKFRESGEIDIFPMTGFKYFDLEQHLMLFYLNMPRRSSDIAQTYVGELPDKGKEHATLMKLTDDSINAIYKNDWESLGAAIDNSWKIKRSLSDKVTNIEIDKIYSTARIFGALGGKVCGAGGGGSLMLIVPPEKQAGVRAALEKFGCLQIPIKFEKEGSRIIFADKNCYVTV